MSSRVLDDSRVDLQSQSPARQVSLQPNPLSPTTKHIKVTSNAESRQEDNTLHPQKSHDQVAKA